MRRWYTQRAEDDLSMGQIFGNINDPRARDSGRGSLSTPEPTPAAGPAPSASSEAPLNDSPASLPPAPVQPYTEDRSTAIQLPDLSLPPANTGVGELLRSRRDDLAERLAATDRLVALSEKRASDLTLDELTEIWENL